MAYDLRAWKVTNYKDVVSVEQCKAAVKKRPREEKLYELEVVKDTRNSRVKVHYVGYDAEYDEWRDEKDVKIIYPVQGKFFSQYACVHASQFVAVDQRSLSPPPRLALQLVLFPAPPTCTK